ncbi:alpha-keto acid decarboxylase family protein [Antarcticibacterium flavum]|uniref:Alpha-keto acid decarboxylase family protein n=1 Tax=Antarcticibacterium flavum TaxID=2058175 RepID=A0A5B7X7I7_9FLAO|nr:MULTISPECIES: thiamine pyrophosphate-binding protein [Antarcticibacterium]MCM4161473.1 pyruvate decarboxylase [Antarcticibacterium sp. W02-3]QCY71060.1 alpha-keto acid decarboxylase family protein [Antarcticibacterium flavum]
MKISEYILYKLKQNGCYWVAGIPGTSCADFFDAIDRDSDIEYIITTNELEAGYIADGYGRKGGIGAVCVSYGVGTLSLVNAVASAFTERVPLIVINGGPSKEDLRIELELGCLFSHSTGSPQTDLNIFKSITVYSEIISQPQNAQKIIDEAFRMAIFFNRPVYIEIPQDNWDKVIELIPTIAPPAQVFINDDFITSARSKLETAKSPVLIIGVEVVRKKLKDKVLQLIDKWNIPFVTTALAKSVLPESHPNFVGCYDSDLFHNKAVFEIIDNSDCPIGLGCIWGIDHRSFIINQFNKMIEVKFDSARVTENLYKQTDLETAIDEFLKWELKFQNVIPEFVRLNGLTDSGYFGHNQIFCVLNKFIKDCNDVQVVMDTCLGSFLGADLFMGNTDMYLANPIWLSIGQGTPAAIGAYLKNGKIPIIITGDGGFQMVAQSFSTMIKYQIPALIIVLDNSLYAIEQYLIDGTYFELDTDPLKYVELHRWAYEEFPKIFKGGFGERVHSAEGLIKVLNKWEKETKKEPWIIACEFSKKDLPRIT